MREAKRRTRGENAKSKAFRERPLDNAQIPPGATNAASSDGSRKKTHTYRTKAQPLHGLQTDFGVSPSTTILTFSPTLYSKINQHSSSERRMAGTFSKKSQKNFGFCTFLIIAETKARSPVPNLVVPDKRLCPP
jgi:hypothetical protein